MPRRFFLVLSLALPLLLVPCCPGASAQEQDERSADRGQRDAAQSRPLELAPLPAQLTPVQIRSLQQQPPVPSQIESQTRHRLMGFYRGAYNRPLTRREVALRESVYELAARHGQFVHVRLVDGKVFTGTIDFTSAEAFQLQTDLSHRHMVHYRQLAESPRPVLAVGTRTVRGLEIGGIVVACIALLPAMLVVYPLIAAGVIQD